MENLKSDNTEKPKAKSIERITIDESLKDKLMSLTEQANVALNPMAAVTKSEVMNFILKSRPDRWSKNELEALKAQHLDEVKLSQWITAKLKEAHANGERISLHELIERNADMFARNQTKPRKFRKQPAPSEDAAIADDKSTTNMTGV